MLVHLLRPGGSLLLNGPWICRSPNLRVRLAVTVPVLRRPWRIQVTTGSSIRVNPRACAAPEPGVYCRLRLLITLLDHAAREKSRASLPTFADSHTAVVPLPAEIDRQHKGEIRVATANHVSPLPPEMLNTGSVPHNRTFLVNRLEKTFDYAEPAPFRAPAASNSALLLTALGLA
jgi:hypothetical protein